jgi:hypothetical protein
MAWMNERPRAAEGFKFNGNAKRLHSLPYPYLDLK